MMEKKAIVTLGADVGGNNANVATSAVCMKLRKALESECLGPYGSAFDEFALVLRIDGSVQAWEKSGVENVRLQRKLKYATADIFVPQTVWQEGPESLLAFLTSCVEAAIQAIVDRAANAGDEIDSQHLLRDVRRAVERVAR